MQSTQIPARFNIPFANAAGPGFIRPIPQASQIGVQDGAASLQDGFVPLNFQPVGAGGVPPFGQDFNGILKQITQWSQWSAARGPVIYDATFSGSIGGYPKGTVLNSSDYGAFWLCTTDNNPSNPDAGGAGWIGFKVGRDALYAIDVSATANIITINPTPATAAYTEGLAYLIKVANASSGPVTINVSGLGVQTVTNRDGTPMVPGALVAGGIYLFTRDATKFQCENPEGTAGQLPGLTGARNYYVNGTTGSDSNDGLAPTTGGGHGPFQTIQKGIDQVPLFNLNGNTITIFVADGTYNAPSAPVALKQINGSGNAVLTGNTTTPTNCLIAGINHSALVQVGDGDWTVQGFKLQSTGTPVAGDPGDCAQCNIGRMRLRNINFGVAQRAHISSAQSRVLIGAGTITISGNATYHILGSASSVVGDENNVSSQYPDLVVSAAVNITLFIEIDTNSLSRMFYKSITNPGNVTGTKYLAFGNGVIDATGLGVNYYPGTIAGSTATGGQYLP